MSDLLSINSEKRKGAIGVSSGAEVVGIVEESCCCPDSVSRTSEPLELSRTPHSTSKSSFVRACWKHPLFLGWCPEANPHTTHIHSPTQSTRHTVHDTHCYTFTPVECKFHYISIVYIRFMAYRYRCCWFLFFSFFFFITLTERFSDLPYRANWCFARFVISELRLRAFKLFVGASSAFARLRCRFPISRTEEKCENIMEARIRRCKINLKCFEDQILNTPRDDSVLMIRESVRERGRAASVASDHASTLSTETFEVNAEVELKKIEGNSSEKDRINFRRILKQRVDKLVDTIGSVCSPLRSSWCASASWDYNHVTY